MSLINKFLPNDDNRRLFPGFVAFLVALGGVILGFTAAAIESRLLGVVGYIITVIGVLGGVVFVGYGCYRTMFNKDSS